MQVSQISGQRKYKRYPTVPSISFNYHSHPQLPSTPAVPPPGWVDLKCGTTSSISDGQGACFKNQVRTTRSDCLGVAGQPAWPLHNQCAASSEIIGIIEDTLDKITVLCLLCMPLLNARMGFGALVDSRNFSTSLEVEISPFDNHIST